MKNRSKILSGIVLPFALLSSMLVPANGATASPIIPNDPLYKDQWNLKDSKVPEIWSRTTGAGQVVAVIDSGIVKHVDLSMNVLVGADMVSSAARSYDGDGRDDDAKDEGAYYDPWTVGETPLSPMCIPQEATDSNWHGTFVAGIIAAKANNSIGIAGVSPDAKILPIRNSAACGIDPDDTTDGINWAAGKEIPGVSTNKNIATVINISSASKNPCPENMQNAINYAVSKNIPVVVAAGNSAEDAINYSPANCKNVITVASSDQLIELSKFSNFGSSIDVTAPGGFGIVAGIKSTTNEGTRGPEYSDISLREGVYVTNRGTSFSAPFVAGTVALMRSLYPHMSPADIEQHLKNTAIPIPSCTEKCGSGLISPVAATSNMPLGDNKLYIDGSPFVGIPLSALYTKSWSADGVALSYRWLRDGAYIFGATKQTYIPGDEDIDSLISVEVIASKPGYASKTSTYSLSGPVLHTTIKSNIPIVLGELEVGQTLTVTHDGWTPSGIEFSYQWRSFTPDGKTEGIIWNMPIQNATNPTYTLTEEDLGKTISVEVWGDLDGAKSVYEFSAIDESKTVRPASFNTSKPTISGVPKVGNTLVVGHEKWGDGVAMTYEWKVDGQLITNHTIPTYAISSNDLGKSISVTAIGSRSGVTKWETSLPTVPVTKASLITTPATISGTVKVGNRLTVNHAPWGPAPVAITYQWYRSGVLIPGATASSYMLTADDRGKIMTVHVTGRKTGYTAVYRKSAATVAVAYGDLKGSFPTLSGTPEVNNTLIASPGLWTAGVTVSYQWYRDGVLVTGASGRYYKLTSADLGKQIKVRVLGKKTGYVSRAYYSLSTAKVVPFPPGGSYLFP